jgi:hypothetical protein
MAATVVAAGSGCVGTSCCAAVSTRRFLLLKKSIPMIGNLTFAFRNRQLWREPQKLTVIFEKPQQLIRRRSAANKTGPDGGLLDEKGQME